MLGFLRFACMVLFVAIPISGWAQTNSSQINIDAAIRSLMGPSSYAQWKRQPDGSWLGPSLSTVGTVGDDSVGVDNPGQLAAECYAARDFTNAAIWGTEGAKQGDALGATILGMLALEGKGGVPRDESRAVTLFQFAAEQGYTRAMVELGDCYLYGKGVPPDRKTAIRILKTAGNEGDLDAMRLLCRIHIDPFDEFGRRNYIAGYWWWRKAMKIELAPENSFMLVQAAEAVVGLITLTVAFFVTRYVWRLIREFRKPSFLEPGSTIKFAFVQDWEEFKQLVKTYRECESAGDRSQPVPVLVNQPQGFRQGFKEGFGASWHDAPMLLEFDRFWKSVCRWALILGLAIVAAGFTSAYHWASHWKILLACLGVLVLTVLAVYVVREQWLLNRLIQTRRAAT